MAILPFELDIDDIAALADIVKDKDLEEIRLEDKEIGSKIVIKSRRCPPPPPQSPMPMPVPFPMSAPAAPQVQITPAAEAPAPVPAAEKKASGNTVKSPIVGTYYASPAPDKPPFVRVGQRVKKGDTLMIIESMKLMNEIQSDFDGEVKEILVNNGDAVEFDQPIMIIG